MSDEYITYFGYGSLVNRATRPASEPFSPAFLLGWQRVWGHRVASSGAERYRCCSLSVQPALTQNAPGIAGVVVTLPRAELPALDEREKGYDRHVLPASQFDLPAECTATEVHVYVSDSNHAGMSNSEYPVLQSYVDCVLAGYCDVFEPGGMQQFVDSTYGWDGEMENDRHKPKYPRAVSVTENQQQQFDELVKIRRLREPR